MFCQACDSGKSASPPPDSSSSADESLKSSAAKNATGATNSENLFPKFYVLPYSILSFDADENDDVLVAQARLSGLAIDAFERGNGDALAEYIAQNLIDLAGLMKVNHLKINFVEGGRLQRLSAMVEQKQKQKQLEKKQKQLEFLQKMHQAVLSAGAAEGTKIVKMPIHERVEDLTHERARKIDPSQWPDLSDMGMVHLLTAEFQNSPLMMDLTSVFQAIQEGNMIQLIITRMAEADEGNKTAEGTVTPLIFAAIIPNPLMEGQTESADMHLLLGSPPLHVNKDNLMSALTAVMNVVSEYEHNADLSLHFFLSPPINIQDNEDPLASIPNIENSINPNLPVSGFATK
ncbi:hypothetical protein [Endozoicomonas sp. 8E]|uniref:hypothetical protein n=1 Tax=Endozoicomonas sp. 8E TaxID=3035692 RepID=UPI0029390B10|nr:hypothetical protein [Endozoicomonas sp. 8E]WOG27764.1 hypothetical protein P6910_24990 [Endozoicomonas sp. 8E]